MIPQDKINLYLTYAPKLIKEAQKGPAGKYLIDDEFNELQASMEQVVKEFNVVKQVLLNNSIPVEMHEI